MIQFVTVLHLIFMKQKNLIPASVQEFKNIFKIGPTEINTEHIDDQNVQKIPPWQQFNIQFDTTLTQFSKNETNEIMFKNEYLSVQEKYVKSLRNFY